ncbi:MAG: DNA-3-methyladenine glycosylase family protein, partial [Nitrososphaerales archaeon]
MEFQLNLTSIPFDLDYTLDCGQVFRWRRENRWWVGVVDGRVLKLKQEEDTLKVKSNSDDADEKFIRRYLRLDDPLPDILTSINKDQMMAGAITRLNGLRLVKQNPWECTISFICATYKNINAIQQMMSNICRLLGRRIEFEGNTHYSFPEPEAVAGADRQLLKNCGLGYRTRFVIEAAERVVSREVVLEDLESTNYETAKRTLLAHPRGRKILLGVGPKVADCILLFSLEKLEAFPIDVWIRRAVLKFYPHLFGSGSIRHLVSSLKNSSIGPAEYQAVSQTMRSYFGEYAGYAQEYLYHYTRVSEPRPSTSESLRQL